LLLLLGGGGFLIPVAYPDSIDVHDIDTFQRLGDLLREIYSSNSFWRFSISKIRTISSSDILWKSCIKLLTITSNVIIIDLTIVKSGTRWELQYIHDLQLDHKTIFIVNEESYNEGYKHLSQYWQTDNLPYIFKYAANGRY
jgi:hypothetical protein